PGRRRHHEPARGVPPGRPLPQGERRRPLDDRARAGRADHRRDRAAAARGERVRARGRAGGLELRPVRRRRGPLRRRGADGGDRRLQPAPAARPRRSAGRPARPGDDRLEAAPALDPRTGRAHGGIVTAVGRLVGSVVVLVAALALPAAAAAKPLPQTPKRTHPPPVNEESPSAAPHYLAWVQNSRSHPHLYNLYAQHDGRTRYRVNPAGTQAGLGTGMDGTTLVYTQTHGAKSSIMMFDLQTKKRSAPPAGVNTPSLEDEPTISGDWLLFHRLELGSSPGEQVILRNVHTG